MKKEAPENINMFDISEFELVTNNAYLECFGIVEIQKKTQPIMLLYIFEQKILDWIPSDKVS